MKVLDRKEVGRIPIASFTQTGTLDLMKASGADWPDALRNAHLMAKLAVAGHEIAGLEVVRIPFGLITEAQTTVCSHFGHFVTRLAFIIIVTSME